MSKYEKRVPHTARSSSNVYQWLHSSSDEGEGAHSMRYLNTGGGTRRSLFSREPSRNRVNATTVVRKKASSNSDRRPVININPFSPFILRSLSSPREEGSCARTARRTDDGDCWPHSFTVNRINFADAESCKKQQTSVDVPHDCDHASSEESSCTQTGKAESAPSLVLLQDFGNEKPCDTCEIVNPTSSQARGIDKTNSNFFNKLNCIRSSSIADLVAREFEVVQSISPLSQKEKDFRDNSRLQSSDVTPTSPLNFAPERKGTSLDISQNTYYEQSLCLSCDDSLYQIHFPTIESAHPRPIIVHRDVNGSVWLVKSALDGQAYFLKEIACDSVEDAQRMLFWEIQALQLADKCENITVLHKNWWDAKRRVSITLTECCSGGLAPHYLMKAMCSELAIREVVFGALHALNTLHSHGLVHGNCYLNNFFVSPVFLDSEEAIYSTVKLGNFGSTRPDYTYMRSYTKDLATGLTLSIIPERIHARLPCDDIREFGQSLLEFLGESAVQKLVNPLRRIILLMAGYLPSYSLSSITNCTDIEENRFQILRYCPYSAVDLLEELEKYGSARLTEVRRAQILDTFRYSNEED